MESSRPSKKNTSNWKTCFGSYKIKWHSSRKPSDVQPEKQTCPWHRSEEPSIWSSEAGVWRGHVGDAPAAARGRLSDAESLHSEAEREARGGGKMKDANRRLRKQIMKEWKQN